MSATCLYHPLNTLKPFGENIWTADGGEIRMAFPLGVKIPFSTRMTVVRLADGGLWCHSPIAPSPELFAQIDALGEVRHLVSPNKIHYAHIAAWKARYPQASGRMGKRGRAREGGGAGHRRGVRLRFGRHSPARVVGQFGTDAVCGQPRDDRNRVFPPPKPHADSD